MTVGRLIDISSAQHPNKAPINWRQVAAAGVEGVMVKATQGTSYVNPFMEADVIGAQQAGIDVACYHFAETGAPTDEARFFLKMAGRFARILDYETKTGVPWARTFLETLGLPAAECMIYGSASSLKDFYQQLPCLAWVAAYGQLYPGWGICWQFTDKAEIPGIVVPVDESRWYGTDVQLEDLFQGPNTPQPIPIPIEEDDVPLYTTNSKGTGFVVATDLSSKTGMPDAADAQELLGTGLYKTVKMTDQLIDAIPDA